MTKMLSGANLPPIEALMDGDLQEWQGAPATTLGAATLYWIPVATHSLKLRKYSAKCKGGFLIENLGHLSIANLQKYSSTSKAKRCNSI